MFIQEFSEDKDYSRQFSIQNTLAKTGEATDGTNKDVRCNIYDMAGNTLEWTTESSPNENRNPCVYRGGLFGFGNNRYVSLCFNDVPITFTRDYYSFCVTIYL